MAPRPYAPVNGATDTPPEHTISVAGSGKVAVVPDIATVRLGVIIERNTAKAAREAAAESMTRIVAAIRALGIEDKDIATSNVSLSPVYSYPANQAPRIRGYQLNNMVTITVRDLDTLSDVLDDGIQSGATSVDGVSFDVEDRAGAEAKAREAAVADAKAKAEALAKGVGVSITGVASIAEQVSTPVWYERACLRRGPDGGRRRRDAGPPRHDRRGHHGPGHVPDPVTAQPSRPRRGHRGPGSGAPRQAGAGCGRHRGAARGPCAGPSSPSPSRPSPPPGC